MTKKICSVLVSWIDSAYKNYDELKSQFLNFGWKSAKIPQLSRNSTYRRRQYTSKQHDVLYVAKLMVVTTFTMTMTNDDEKVCEQLSLNPLLSILPKIFPQNLLTSDYSWCLLYKLDRLLHLKLNFHLLLLNLDFNFKSVASWP